MAIVSSHSVSCGNAAFTRVLHKSIERSRDGIDTEVIELDLTLLQSVDRGIRSKANDHISDICCQLKEFDCVNIQMEAGLYGTVPRDIVKRFSKLVTANKNTNVTLHSPRLIAPSASARSAIKKIFFLRFRSGLEELFLASFKSINIKINKKIIRHCIASNSRIIVHTLRAKKQIENLFSYTNVDVHPLKMVDEGHSHDPKTFQNQFTQANLDPNDIHIGIFGYISSYKGHVDALNALQQLPLNFKLLIFGRLHPAALIDGALDPYLSHLIEMVNSREKLKNRVLFLGELDDSDFLDVVSDIDVAWLPHHENGQDGSGIASLCLDLCPRVLCSSSFAFDELLKLVQYNNVMRFDIGNTVELASKTQMILNRDEPSKPYGGVSRYNVRTQADIYLTELDS